MLYIHAICAAPPKQEGAYFLLERRIGSQNEATDPLLGQPIALPQLRVQADATSRQGFSAVHQGRRR